jgi:hypothetical protein
MSDEPRSERCRFSVGKHINGNAFLQIDEDRAIGSAAAKRSGKGNGVAAVPSPKNRTGKFLYIRLKPFFWPVLPDAVSLRVTLAVQLLMTGGMEQDSVFCPV